MIEIIENVNEDVFMVVTSDGQSYEFISIEDAVGKAHDLCDCNDEFNVIPFFDDEL
tara:strand:+ start:883 stop:1050 length:168 start_codon:yes stop_codon:yes gene_type:complete